MVIMSKFIDLKGTLSTNGVLGVNQREKISKILCGIG